MIFEVWYNVLICHAIKPHGSLERRQNRRNLKNSLLNSLLAGNCGAAKAEEMCETFTVFLGAVRRYWRTSVIGSGPSGTRCQLVGSLSSKRQNCPPLDLSTSSP